MILDAGALIAINRNDRAMIARLLVAYEEGDELRTHPMVVTDELHLVLLLKDIKRTLAAQ